MGYPLPYQLWLGELTDPKMAGEDGGNLYNLYSV